MVAVGKERSDWIIQGRLDEIASKRRALPINFENRDYARAVYNVKNQAEAYVEIGVLRWRQGIDPRPDFASAISAYGEAVALAQKHEVPRSEFGLCPLTYVAFSLMGQHTELFFQDPPDRLPIRRYPLYEHCLCHWLHDHEPDEPVIKLLEWHLSKKPILYDDVFRNYFQLLGKWPADKDRATLVGEAESYWLKRKTSRHYHNLSAIDGHGEYNDIYLDLRLSAVMKKIGWTGESIHRWVW